MKIKTIAAMLSLILVFSVATLSASAVEFCDMPNDWSETALNNAVTNGLLQGYDGKILANESVTRAQMAAIVTRAFGATTLASIEEYQDVPADAWYVEELSKAVQMGILMGDGTRLYPEQSITREEAFVVISRAFKMSGSETTVLDKFSDQATISSWAEDAVASLVDAGYVAGFDGKINPKATITRAEFAKLMDNLVKHYIKEAKADGYTEDFEGTVMVDVPGVTFKNLIINGDLIIGDGVGDGDVILDSVTVTGRTIIRGGGVNSIKIMGTSSLANIIIARVDGQVRVFSEDGTNVGEVIVDGKDDVVIEGKMEKVTVLASDITLTANQATIASIQTNGSQNEIVVSKESKVATMQVAGADTKIKVSGKVETVHTTTEANNATVEGSGTVGSVEANANDIVVSTPNTKVSAGKGTSGVMAGETPINAGSSKATNSTGSAAGTSSSSSHSRPSPYFRLNSVEIDGKEVLTQTEENITYYQISKSWTETTPLRANVTGANFENRNYEMEVAVRVDDKSLIWDKTVSGDAMNGTKTITQSNLRDKLDTVYGISVLDLAEKWTRVNPGQKITVTIGIEDGATLWTGHFIIVEP